MLVPRLGGDDKRGEYGPNTHLRGHDNTRTRPYGIEYIDGAFDWIAVSVLKRLPQGDGQEGGLLDPRLGGADKRGGGRWHSEQGHAL